MRRSLLVITALTLTVIACTKKTNYYTTPTTQTGNGYIINGISDVNIESRDTVFMPIEIEGLNGEQPRLSLSISGLPADSSIVATFSNTSGYPTFGTELMIMTNNATLGTLPIKINVNSDSGLVKSYPVNIKVVPISNCNGDLVGNYLTDYACNNAGTNTNNVFIIPDGNKKNSVTINSIWPFFFNAKANINCEQMMVTIPEQLNSFGYKIKGSGVYNADSMVINYTIETPGPTIDSCKAVLIKQ